MQQDWQKHMVLEEPHSQTLKEQKDNIENYAEDFS